MNDEIDRDPSRRDLLRGAAGAAALSGLAGAAHAQETADDAASVGGAPDVIAQELGNGLTPPGEPVPERLTARPMPARISPPEPPGRRLGWAVAGLGDFAIDHQIPPPDDAEHSKLAGLVSGNAEKANAVAGARAIDRAHLYSSESFDSIANDDAIDVIYVITPNGLHEDLVVRALQAGKHVL